VFSLVKGTYRVIIFTRVYSLQEPFNLIAGHPALDFANALDNRYHPNGPVELIGSYKDLVRFCVQSALLNKTQMRHMLTRINEPEATAALESARELREAIERIFSALADQRNVDRNDLSVLNHHLEQALMHRKISKEKAGFVWTWEGIENFATGPLWPIAHAAGELLASEDRRFVRQCGRATCRWLFLDTSKNRSRRWCEMRVCGNRTKAQRYYKRRTKASTA
jgi:predicted RNA-binding Zn ribbon-like protein